MKINVIQMDDFISDNSYSKALNQMHELFEGVDQLKNGNQVQFRFRDIAGNEMDEETFFKKTITIENGPSRIAKILQKFMAHDGYEYLYFDEEMTAMSFAIRELVLCDEQYIDLYTKYIHGLDSEHDIYHQGILLDLVFNKYNWSKRLLSLLAVIEVCNGQGESYISFYDEDQKLKTFLEEKKNIDHFIAALKQYADNDKGYVLELLEDSESQIGALLIKHMA